MTRKLPVHRKIRLAGARKDRKLAALLKLLRPKKK